MLQRMNCVELSYWSVYFGLYPFSDERRDIGVGHVVSAIANVNRPKGKRALIVEECMPKYGRRKKRAQTFEEMRAVMGLFADTQNELVNRRKK